MTGIGALHARRSAASVAFPTLIVLVALHIFGRGRIWVYEWLWAFYQYQFVTVLLGPVVAGGSAWEGRRVARAREVAESAGMAVRTVLAAWAGVCGWVLAAYGAGLVIVVLLVWLAGTPGWPDAASISTVGPAVAVLAGAAAVGIGLGYALRSPLVPAVVTVGWFLAVLYFYIAGPSRFVDVGGASGSLLGLAPRPELQAAQIALYASLAAASFLALVWGRGLHGMRRAGAVAAAVVLVAPAAWVLEGLGPDHFRTTDERLVCVGTRPEVCVGPGYASFAEQARAMLIPYLAELEAAGVDVPQRFEQTAGRGEAAAPLGGLMFALVRYGPAQAARSAPFEIIDRYVPPDCDIFREPASTAWDGVTDWLIARVDPQRAFVPPSPRILSEGTLREQRAWVREAVQTLMTCGT
ncbi:MAG: hypothetical protein KatS3mg014_0340 [Actinomycetota bacterium]|nr:MAG: hypothetical protein KatS3mg014_0340 [Actinomycetota bacterium]